LLHPQGPDPIEATAAAAAGLVADKDEYDDLPDPIIIGGQVGRIV
jgi:hypothetical protein